MNKLIITMLIGKATELKEARAKIVNLQYDIKIKDDEITRLNHLLNELQLSNPNTPFKSNPSLSASPSSSTLTENLMKSTEEINNLKLDIARLINEKTESENAGRLLTQQVKSLELVPSTSILFLRHKYFLRHDALAPCTDDHLSYAFLKGHNSRKLNGTMRP
jgi:hypothetical protein